MPRVGPDQPAYRRPVDRGRNGRAASCRGPGHGTGAVQRGGRHPRPSCIAALDAGARAQCDWAARAPGEGGPYLRRAGEALRDEVERVALLVTPEVGKPLAESRAEVEFAAEHLEWWCAEEAVRADLGIRAFGVQVFDYRNALALGHADIRHAAESAGFLLELPPSETAPLYRALSTSLIVSYARPFTANRPHGALSREWGRFGDDYLQHVHDWMLETRNQSRAHSDGRARIVRIIPPGVSARRLVPTSNDLAIQVSGAEIPEGWRPAALKLCQDLARAPRDGHERSRRRALRRPPASLAPVVLHRRRLRRALSRHGTRARVRLSEPPRPMRRSLSVCTTPARAAVTSSAAMAQRASRATGCCGSERAGGGRPAGVWRR